MSAAVQQQLTQIARAKVMTSERLAKSPTYGVYLHAKEQLDYIESILLSGRTPTAAESKKVDIGLMAVKELEARDLEYAELLMDINDHFDQLAGV